MRRMPRSVARMLWAVDSGPVGSERDRALVLERVKPRGTRDAMIWLGASYRRAQLAKFVLSEGTR